MDELRTQLKAMNRQFHFYVKQKTAMKNNLINLIDQTTQMQILILIVHPAVMAPKNGLILSIRIGM